MKRCVGELEGKNVGEESGSQSVKRVFRQLASRVDHRVLESVQTVGEQSGSQSVRECSDSWRAEWITEC